MNWNNLIPMLPVIGSIIGGGATILGLFVWLMKRHNRSVSRAEARAKRLQKERDEAVEQKDAAERIRIAERAEIERIMEAARRNHRIATINFDVCQRLKAEWGKARQHVEAAEAHAEKSEASLAAANEHIDRHRKQIDEIVKQDGKVWCARIITDPPRFVPLARRHQQRPAIISVLNLKGGVGKTTLTANLGGYLAHHREKWVLLLDLDHQRSLTQSLFTSQQRVDAEKKGRTVQAVLRTEGSKPILEAAEQVQGNSFNRLWVVGNSDPAEGYGETHNLDDREMALLAEWLLNPTKSDVRYLLRAALHHARPIQERYNYVLIDCPPRLTTACINALAASDLVLIPVQPEPVAAASIVHLLRRLRPMREAGLIPELRVLVVGNMISRNEDSAKRELKLIREHAEAAAVYWKPSLLRVSGAHIRESGYYAKYQRDSLGNQQVQLPAVAVEDICSEYGRLTKEIEKIENELREEHIHDNYSIARVSS